MKAINNIKRLFTRRKDLRNKSTPQEIYLWVKIKNSQLGAKFRRQHSIGGYIIDFYCPNKKLAIEVDGSQHFTKENIEYDKTRDDYLKEIGINTLRFTNKEINTEIESVLEKIKSYISPPC